MYNIETMGRTVLGNVQRLCKKKGMSIRKLEAVSGVSHDAIYQWGKRYTPGLATVAMVANALEVSVEELLEVENHDA